MTGRIRIVLRIANVALLALIVFSAFRMYLVVNGGKTADITVKYDRRPRLHASTSLDNLASIEFHAPPPVAVTESGSDLAGAELTGVFANHASPESSFAVVRLRSGEAVLASPGDSIMPDVTVSAVNDRDIVINNGGRFERLDFPEDEKAGAGL